MMEPQIPKRRLKSPEDDGRDSDDDEKSSDDEFFCNRDA